MVLCSKICNNDRNPNKREKADETLFGVIVWAVWCLPRKKEDRMDVCETLNYVRVWLEPLAAVATFVLSFIVLRMNKRADAEMKQRQKTDALLQQPSKISAWLCLNKRDSFDNGILFNASDIPVYKVVVTAVVTKGYGCSPGEAVGGTGGYRALFAVLPPGGLKFHMDLMGIWGMHAYPMLEISFMCADGNSWIRRADGSLEGIEEDPFEHYEIGRPCEFSDFID